MENRVPTVLCVDDDPEVLEVLREYLTGQGFCVVSATNGVDALLEVTQRIPRAAILDVCMPHLGGLEALRRIKRFDPELVAILVSGVPNALEMVRESGVNLAGVLSKPLDLARLSETLARAGVVPQSAPPRSPDPSADACPSIPKRVLVVDDDPEFRAMLVEHLQSRRIHALDAASGEEALRRFSEFRPHVVLLDILMPGISGLETLRRLKTLRQESCVVMVSAKDDEETLREALELGADDYVSKPLDFAYLDSVLEAGRR